MAKLLGEGDCTAGGQTWHLRFDMNVLADLQEKTGLNPVAIMGGLQADGGDIALIRKVCHAMLKRYHPEATIDVAGDILSEDMESLMAIIMASVPEAAVAGGAGNGAAKVGQAA